MKNSGKRINVALQHIEQRLQNFKKRRNLCDKINSIKKMKKKESECHCVANPYLNALYGVNMPCVHNAKLFVIEVLEPIQISKMFHFSCTHYSLTEWVFPEKKKYPAIEYCGNEALLTTIYGKPNIAKLGHVIQQLETSENMERDDTKKFVSKAFITFSAMYFGYYNYEIETIAVFQVYIRKILGQINDDVIVNYEAKECKKKHCLT